jgi:hypothetical protein
MKFLRHTFALLVVVLASQTLTYAQAPLPSWNDGPAKQAIVDFVRTATENGGAKFVPPEERIATFDQDGTLWVEQDQLETAQLNSWGPGLWGFPVDGRVA